MGHSSAGSRARSWNALAAAFGASLAVSISSFAAAQPTPPPLGPALPAFRPEQPAAKDAPAPPAPGAISSADELLTALEKQDKTLRTLAAQVQYDKRASKLEAEDRQTRTGSLFFEDRRHADDGAPAPNAEPNGNAEAAAPDTGRRFAVVFKSLAVDGPNGREVRPENEVYILNGEYLVRKEPDAKQIFKYRLAKKEGGAIADPLRLGEGPFPIPIGQRKDDVLARFAAELRPGLDEIVIPPPADTDEDRARAERSRRRFDSCYQLRLVPKPNSEEARQYREIRVWYFKDTLLPSMARTVETDGSRSEFQLLKTDMKVNQTLPDGVFDISVPAGWAVEENEFRRKADK
jgi:hypothetical protein